LRLSKLIFRLSLVLAILGAAVATGLLVPSREVARAQKRTSDQSAVERGRYLVEEVAMCGECHSPRKANGELDHSAWLQGAPVWIMPVKPIPNWADHVPALAGMPSFTDEQFERVLEQGIGPQGETLRPPMHIYHMHPEDAKAILAYLKSLAAPPH
jgi:mono/diheme cytochrome c family protein